MKHFTKRKRVREVFRSVGLSLGMVLATLAALEIFLRVADFRELREGLTERSLSYAYDTELGWAPVPNSSSLITTFRTTHFKHNSLGLRDKEPNGPEEQAEQAQFDSEKGYKAALLSTLKRTRELLAEGRL